MRPSTKASRHVKRSAGTCVTKSVQAASASRVALTWRPLSRATARKRRRRLSATSCGDPHGQQTRGQMLTLTQRNGQCDRVHRLGLQEL